MKITKKLFNYLDQFNFVDDSEKNGAIIDFFIWENPCFYSDIVRASEIVDIYTEYLRLKDEKREINRKILKTL